MILNIIEFLTQSVTTSAFASTINEFSAEKKKSRPPLDFVVTTGTQANKLSITANTAPSFLDKAKEHLLLLTIVFTFILFI